MPARLLALLACLLASTGCIDACRSLARQICACQPDQGSQDNCNLQAQNQENVYPVTSADEKFCQSKLDSSVCDCANQSSPAATAACCAKLNTPEGRSACGLVINSP
ncbi:MAG: hypothetical protein ACXWLM_03225 [Myxococcales bacterium]